MSFAIRPHIVVDDPIMAPSSPKGASSHGQRDEPATVIGSPANGDVSAQLKSQPPRFLQRLVHEVRSPAHAMHISISILNDALHGIEMPEEAREAMQMLSNTSEELRYTLRSLSRYAHTLDDLQPISLDVGNRINNVWKKLSANKAAVSFNNTVDAVMLTGDDRLFDLAVECILDNSLKFVAQDRPCEISVSHERNSDGLVLQFRDNGIGIEEEYLDKCYQHFERLFPRTVFPGAGLGIPTAITCLKHMNGKIEIAPQPEGTLVSFRFSV